MKRRKVLSSQKSDTYSDLSSENGVQIGSTIRQASFQSANRSPAHSINLKRNNTITEGQFFANPYPEKQPFKLEELKEAESVIDEEEEEL